MSKSSSRRISKSQAATLLVVLFGLATGLPLLCWLGYSAIRKTSTAAEPTLVLAYSPEKEELFSQLLSDFGRQGFTTSAGETIRIQAVAMWPEAMVEAAVTGEVQAICPDSSLWLTLVDETWQEQTLQGSPLVGEVVRFAVSPVVIAMWEDVARSLGYPDRPIGWADILERARTDDSFRWSHPSTSTASGMLATLAEFYAGAGKTRGLTIDDAMEESTLQYVAAVESTVKHYGEGELAAIEQALAHGRADLDAFVVQEQLVIYFNSKSQERLVAVYPAEGTLWEDHPLALLEQPHISTQSREAFQALKDFLRSDEAQRIVLSHGYRPADLTLPLDGPGSPLVAANGVDASQPRTVLQMPSDAVVRVVRDVWWYTKRHTNVFLVVDTSGSMSGSKMESARQALRAFVDSIRGDLERVGLIDFGTTVKRIVPLADLGENRRAIRQAVEELEVGGDTALLDAVSVAYRELQRIGDTERINAVVVMTDGRENASETNLRELVWRIQDGNKRGVPIVIFCIAYGRDADRKTLSRIAEASGGQMREGDLTSIEELYRVISTYF